MRTRPTTLLVATLLVPTLGLLGAGCYDAHLCGGPEVCNLLDDDCDGLVDEGFVDEDGRYRQTENCGACGVSCTAAFPTAEEVACLDAVEGPTCRIVSCPANTHPAGDGACVPDVPVLCLPCTTDLDCALRQPTARCLETATGALRCGQPCADESECPAGFSCEGSGMETARQCVPRSGVCGCTSETSDVELACVLEGRVPGTRCAGVMRCGEDGPSACEPVLVEACNEQDDDCDGEVDEDFRDEAGRYIARMHCGACASPCVEPGPNMVATCLPDGASARCEVECAEGFVDVDGILANGCECERWDGEGPPPIIGGDSDCDGTPDDTTDFVYVSATGSDTNPGTLAAPMRTIQAALARARAEHKDVVVSRGIYAGPFDLVAGVSLFGGYSPDFRDRDPELYPVLLERRAAEGGLPVLRCTDVREPTRVEGFTVQASDATRAGGGSSAITIDRCGPEVRFASLTILAGRGRDGLAGDDSSANLAAWGLRSLAELDGASGADGRGGTGDLEICRRIEGGAGGHHACRGVDVSGGGGGAAQCPGAICSMGRPCGNAGCTDFTTGGVCDLDAALAIAESNPPARPGSGPSPGAAGEPTYNSPTNRGVCNFCDDNPTLPRDGGAGGDGAEGVSGAGGAGCGVAFALDAEGRLSAGAGGAGSAGTDGSGGGGGTAGAGYEVVAGSGACDDRAGGSGGGGGSGGCGAPGASGGSGGGGSAGVVMRLGALARGPSFDHVRVVTATGGSGGDGGIGAAGGSAGTGALGGVARFWCSRTGGRGGDGGRGGSGGGGGGGCGGGSHAVFLSGSGGLAAYRDELAASLTIEAAGVAGRAGHGGFSPGASGGVGLAGSSDPIFLAP